MRYMLLIYGDEQAAMAMSPEQMQATMQDWFRYTAELRQSGKLLAGDPLQPVATATTVRAAGASVTDGPYAETKEQLGGYYLIEAADLDEAIAWAAKMPNYTAAGNAVEVRPVMEMTFPS